MTDIGLWLTLAGTVVGLASLTFGYYQWQELRKPQIAIRLKPIVSGLPGREGHFSYLQADISNSGKITPQIAEAYFVCNGKRVEPSILGTSPLPLTNPVVGEGLKREHIFPIPIGPENGQMILFNVAHTARELRLEYGRKTTKVRVVLVDIVGRKYVSKEGVSLDLGNYSPTI